ncbi:dephospho-CoA kinase [Salibacterium salarium]|uniref:Dephospho-CoA kinase n=1 Tax=Salibacterium salarium TaxID=284579 RepID=A0A3R9Q5Y5_9BACI|nr:dephospho-CoA kinase [Salibacterium salarium]RSL34302.1 dephospho-CoA kinase [Salibacterium salarium]
MIIGLTGGIASGKSLVSTELEQYGYPVIDADQIAREVVEPGELAYEQIVEHFGSEILELDGSLNRKKLGTLIFSDSEKRQILNQIMHPAIRKRMLEKKAMFEKQGYDVMVFDLPLLIENNLQFMVDKVLLVYVNKEEQKRRLIHRDQAGEEDANQRIASQMSLDDKLDYADAIIDNNTTREHTIAQLKDILKQWNIH